MEPQRSRRLALMWSLCGWLAAAAAGGPVPTASLAAGRQVELPPLAIDPSGEHIYGVSYRVRATGRVAVRPAGFRTLDGARRERQAERIDAQGYGLFRVDADRAWRTGRIEVFSKRGAAWLLLTLAAEGEGTAEITDVRAVAGGFPDRPPMAGPPYLDWIESLRADRALARTLPGPRIAEIADAGAAQLRREVAPYLELAPARLAELMPERRPVSFNGGDFESPAVPEWDPREPEVLRSRRGEVLRIEQRYPVTGSVDTEAPNGQRDKYPYHEPPGARRVYLDRFLTSARCNHLLRAAYQLALLYRKTGEREYALRAAAILGAFGRVLPGYPIFGRRDWNDPVRQFHPPDSYECWFAFTIAEWYTPFGSRMTRTIQAYELIRDAPVWSELARATGRDGRKDIEEALLALARLTLKYDAYQRIEPWKFYHNTIAGELGMLADLGRALGCPELVHYAARKIAGTLRYNFMADGMFPESTSYFHDLLGGIASVVAASLQRYSDPPGYRSRLDGRSIRGFDPRTAIPHYQRATEVLNRLVFPDNSLVPLHDTWANSEAPRPHADRSPVVPYLLPEFGHAVLGTGEGEDAFEAHLHFSGNYNHAHADMLNFGLWAYGDELVSDTGYSAAGSYGRSTLSHNLVVVDGAWQRVAGVGRGDLLAWHDRPEGAQFAQVSAAEQAYPSASRYRRAIVLVPFGPGRNAALDIFEVRGGSRQEWMANGVADYDQRATSDLEAAQVLDNLAEDGRPLEQPPPEENAGGPAPDQDRRRSIYYGAFRNVRVSPNRPGWQVTLSASGAVAADAPWAGERARSAGPKPGLRLNWVWPPDGQVMLGEAPRDRYFQANDRSLEARQAWAGLRMPKVIVRREGADLDSQFVALWEPYQRAPWIDSIQRVAEIAPGDGAGVVLAAGGARATVLYRTPESARAIAAPGLELDGRFAVARESAGEQALDLYEAASAAVGPWIVRLARKPALPVIGQEGAALLLRGRVQAGGGMARFLQPGQPSRWLPLESAGAAPGGRTRVVLARDPGFAFDAGRGFLREQYFPHRSFYGPAAVEIPVWAGIRWSRNGTRLRVSANTAVTLERNGAAIRQVRVRNQGGPWRSAALRRGPHSVAIELADPGGAWLELEVE